MKHILVGVLFLSACGEVKNPSSDAPEIESISPDRGGIVGGATITITGSGFITGEGENVVIVGDREALDVVAEDGGTLVFTLPPSDLPGEVVDVLVGNRDGVAIAEDALTYNQAPTFSRLSRNFGALQGGTVLTITGHGFESNDPGETTVTIGAVEADDVTVVSDSEIEFVVPSRDDDDPLGPHEITVSNANGSFVAGSFLYLRPGLLATAGRGARFLYHIDLETFEATALLRMNSNVSALTLTPDGQLYGAAGGCCNKVVGTFDPVTARLTTLSTSLPASDIAASGTQLFSTGRRDGVLHLLDRTTGVETAIGPMGIGTESIGLAARDEDTLYAVSLLDGPIFVINKETGVSTPGATLGGTAGFVTHGLVLLDEDTLLIAAHNRNNNTILYRATIATGAVEVVKEYENFNISAMTLIPESF